jgi:hypothetical protein
MRRMLRMAGDVRTGPYTAGSAGRLSVVCAATVRYFFSLSLAQCFLVREA